MCNFLYNVGNGGRLQKQRLRCNFRRRLRRFRGGTNRQKGFGNRQPVTSKDGYEFVGWSDKKGGSANVDENYVVNGNVTLFAVFVAVQDYNCSVSFSTSGTAVKNTTVKRGSEIGSLPFTDKLGYTFSGWYYE